MITLEAINLMSSGRIIPRSLLKLPLSLLVKSTAIPTEPIKDLDIDLDKPIVYALPFRSNVDLFTLRRKALEIGLPDPLLPLRILFAASSPENDQRFGVGCERFLDVS